MTGSDWSFIGVALSVVGTLVAAYGARVSSSTANMRSEQLATKSDEIAQLSQANAKLSQELAAFATGGDSFFYVHLADFGKPANRAEIRNFGKYPVRDTQINVFDVTEQFADLAGGRIKEFALTPANRKDVSVDVAYPHLKDRVLTSYIFETNATRPMYAYFLYITNATGRFRQVIHLVNTNGKWQQAYVVDRLLDDRQAEHVVQYFDDGYPQTGDRLTPNETVNSPH